MGSKEKYEVTDEIADMFNKFLAIQELRDLYIKVPFGFKKAKRCALEAQECRSQFWQMVRELYPELSGYDVKYNQSDRILTKITKQ